MFIILQLFKRTLFIYYSPKTHTHHFTMFERICRQDFIILVSFIGKVEDEQAINKRNSSRCLEVNVNVMRSLAMSSWYGCRHSGKLLFIIYFYGGSLTERLQLNHVTIFIILLCSRFTLKAIHLFAVIRKKKKFMESAQMKYVKLQMWREEKI